MRVEPRAFPDGNGGAVSGVVAYPDGPPATLSVVLAPGAGSDLHTPLLVYLQERLAKTGYRNARFNFPYKEHGRRLPDRAPVLERCFRSVIATLRADLGFTRLVLGGKSMGGRMATHLAAAGDDLAGLILLGYPLHPAHQPEKLRIEHLPRITVPMLFFAGTRDALCDLDRLREAMGTLQAPATLHTIADGDHSFVVRRGRTGKSSADIYAEVAGTTIEWLNRLEA